MKKKVVIAGRLFSQRHPFVEGEETKYTVTIGCVPLEEYVAAHCDNGGFYRIELSATNRHDEISGPLDVFMMKIDTGYYQNGWRVGQNLEKRYSVHFGGKPLESVVGRLFNYNMNQKNYDRGWHRITITRLW